MFPVVRSITDKFWINFDYLEVGSDSLAFYYDKIHTQCRLHCGYFAQDSNFLIFTSLCINFGSHVQGVIIEGIFLSSSIIHRAL